MSRAHTDRVTHRHLHFIATITQTRLYCWLNCRFMFSSCPSHTHTHSQCTFIIEKHSDAKKMHDPHTHIHILIEVHCCELLFLSPYSDSLARKNSRWEKNNETTSKKKVLFEIYLKFNPTTNLNLLPVDVLGPGPEPTSKLTFAQIAAGWAHCHNSTMRW